MATVSPSPANTKDTSKEFPHDYPYYPNPNSPTPNPSQPDVDEKVLQSHHTAKFVNERGENIWYQRYNSIDDDTTTQNGFKEKGCVVVFCHGIQEHSTRYCHVMQRLAMVPGVRVIAMDWVVHGMSDSVKIRAKGDNTLLRGYFDRLEHIMDDMRHLVNKIVMEDMNPYNVIFWGQSFGGLIAGLSACYFRDKLPETMKQGLILTSAAINVDPEPPK